jgi:hypothetical protein
MIDYAPAPPKIEHEFTQQTDCPASGLGSDQFESPQTKLETTAKPDAG